MISNISWTIFLLFLANCFADIDIGLRPEYTGPKYIKEGSSFQIKCLTNKLQNPQWTQIVENENKTKYIGRPSQSLPGDVRQEVFLDIIKATSDHAGNYTCHKFSQTYHEIIFINVTFFVDIVTNAEQSDAKPFLTASFKGPSVNKVEGETLRINCTAEGFPKPQIYWLKDKVNISDSNNTRYTIEGNQTTSYLNINELEENDRANYSCIAISRTGETSESIFVRVKDKLAALWPFLGIIAEVAVLCTIIFIYEKRRAKREFDESDTDQSPPDKKNVAENTDVRQRK
uniref:Ig-like domain-containing protein n=1 Tax=Strigamia maritima TaxID=126957 RepID=T1ILJ3_STRMM